MIIADSFKMQVRITYFMSKSPTRRPIKRETITTIGCRHISASGQARPPHRPIIITKPLKLLRGSELMILSLIKQLIMLKVHICGVFYI